MPQLRIEVMAQMIAFMRNVHLVNFQVPHKILLEDFDTQVGREDIFNPTVRKFVMIIGSEW